MATSNPALSEDAFRTASVGAGAARMTVAGAALKSVLLTVVLAAAGAASWTLTVGPGAIDSGNKYRFWFGIAAPLVALVVAFVTCYFPRFSMVTAPLYAVLEGLALGAVSAFFNEQYRGIAAEAAALTVGVLAAMAVLYMTRWIVVTSRFRAGVSAATLGVFFAYLGTFLLRLIGIPFPYIHDGDLFDVGLSIVVVVIAALNLTLDFDTIEQGAKAGAPKYMEWYAAFGLLVTLVWLYLEVLRLLAKLRGKDD